MKGGAFLYEKTLAKDVFVPEEFNEEQYFVFNGSITAGETTSQNAINTLAGAGANNLGLE